MANLWFLACIIFYREDCIDDTCRCMAPRQGVAIRPSSPCLILRLRIRFKNRLQCRSSRPLCLKIRFAESRRYLRRNKTSPPKTLLVTLHAPCGHLRVFSARNRLSTISIRPSLAASVATRRLTRRSSIRAPHCFLKERRMF